MRPSSRNLIRELAVFVIFVWIVLTALFISSKVVPQMPIMQIYKCMCISDGQMPSWAIHYALNKGIFDQYVAFLGSTITGEFGVSASVFPGTPVNAFIWTYLFNTLLVVGASLIAAILIAKSFVRIRAAHMSFGYRKMPNALSIARMSAPALIAAIVFASLLYYCLNPFFGLDQGASLNALLAFLCLAIGGGAFLVNKGRESLEDSVREGCISRALAEGMKDKAAVRQCVKASSSAEFLRVIPVAFAWLLSADIIIENIFTYDGLGALVWEASKTEIDTYLLHTALFMILMMALTVYFAMRVASFHVSEKLGETTRKKMDRSLSG